MVILNLKINHHLLKIKFRLIMFNRNDKRELYWLIGQYLSDKINLSRFIRDFYWNFYWHFYPDNINTLTTAEINAFNVLGNITNDYSYAAENESEFKKTVSEVQTALKNQTFNCSFEEKNTFDIFKRAGVYYSWLTVYVGRKLNRLTDNEVERYATEYLVEHADCTNINIIQLACNEIESKDIDDKYIKLLAVIADSTKFGSMDCRIEQVEMCRKYER
jgi:hypothetical protein